MLKEKGKDKTLQSLIYVIHLFTDCVTLCKPVNLSEILVSYFSTGNVTKIYHCTLYEDYMQLKKYYLLSVLLFSISMFSFKVFRSVCQGYALWYYSWIILRCMSEYCLAVNKWTKSLHLITVAYFWVLSFPLSKAEKTTFKRSSKQSSTFKLLLCIKKRDLKCVSLIIIKWVYLKIYIYIQFVNNILYNL